MANSIGLGVPAIGLALRDGQRLFEEDKAARIQEMKAEEDYRNFMDEAVKREAERRLLEETAVENLSNYRGGAPVRAQEQAADLAGRGVIAEQKLDPRYLQSYRDMYSAAIDEAKLKAGQAAQSLGVFTETDSDVRARAIAEAEANRLAAITGVTQAQLNDDKLTNTYSRQLQNAIDTERVLGAELGTRALVARNQAEELNQAHRIAKDTAELTRATAVNKAIAQTIESGSLPEVAKAERDATSVALLYKNMATAFDATVSNYSEASLQNPDVFAECMSEVDTLYKTLGEGQRYVVSPSDKDGFEGGLIVRVVNADGTPVTKTDKNGNKIPVEVKFDGNPANIVMGRSKSLQESYAAAVNAAQRLREHELKMAEQALKNSGAAIQEMLKKLPDGKDAFPIMQDVIFGQFNFTKDEATGEWRPPADMDEETALKVRDTVQQVIRMGMASYSNALAAGKPMHPGGAVIQALNDMSRSGGSGTSRPTVKESPRWGLPSGTSISPFTRDVTYSAPGSGVTEIVAAKPKSEYTPYVRKRVGDTFINKDYVQWREQYNKVRRSLGLPH